MTVKDRELNVLDRTVTAAKDINIDLIFFEACLRKLWSNRFKRHVINSGKRKLVTCFVVWRTDLVRSKTGPQTLTNPISCLKKPPGCWGNYIIVWNFPTRLVKMKLIIFLRISVKSVSTSCGNFSFKEKVKIE